MTITTHSLQHHATTTVCISCVTFLNQARAGQSACAWFLKIDPVRIVGMRVRVRVCVRAQGY